MRLILDFFITLRRRCFAAERCCSAAERQSGESIFHETSRKVENFTRRKAMNMSHLCAQPSKHTCQKMQLYLYSAPPTRTMSAEACAGRLRNATLPACRALSAEGCLLDWLCRRRLRLIEYLKKCKKSFAWQPAHVQIHMCKLPWANHQRKFTYTKFTCKLTCANHQRKFTSAS